MCDPQCLVCSLALEDAGECLAFNGLIVYKEGRAVEVDASQAITIHRDCLQPLLDGYFIELSLHRRNNSDR